MLLFSVLATVAGTLLVQSAGAQIAWTPAQKDVWNTELAIGDLFVKGDYPGAMDYFDDAFVNWAPNKPIPVSKEHWAKNFLYYMNESGRKYLHFSATPLDIWVEGDYAYVDYYSTYVVAAKDGKKTGERGCNLDVFRKKDGKWLMVASMTMDAPKPQ